MRKDANCGVMEWRSGGIKECCAGRSFSEGWEEGFRKNPNGLALLRFGLKNSAPQQGRIFTVWLKKSAANVTALLWHWINIEIRTPTE